MIVTFGDYLRSGDVAMTVYDHVTARLPGWPDWYGPLMFAAERPLSEMILGVFHHESDPYPGWYKAEFPTYEYGGYNGSPYATNILDYLRGMCVGGIGILRFRGSNLGAERDFIYCTDEADAVSIGLIGR